MMRRRARRLRQWVQHAPGLGPVRRRTVQALRKNSTLRVLVKRLYSIDVTLPLPLDVAPGKVLGGVGTEALPVTLVLVLGTDRPTFTATIDDIARLQRLTAGFRPVIVTDQPAFAVTRRYGYPMELLLTRDTWDASDQGSSWDEYARERIALLFSTYRATASVTLGPDGLDTEAALLLGALRPAH